jgi:hypothetical protein
MHFVVAAEIETDVRADRFFERFLDARACYDDLTHVCMDGPDASLGGDKAIVTNCWIYSVEASEANAAFRMVKSGHAILLEACFAPN